MTKRKTPLTDELDAYTEEPELVEVDTAEFKVPSFVMRVDKKMIAVYDVPFDVITTNIQMQYTNLFGKRDAGTYLHNGSKVIVSDL